MVWCMLKGGAQTIIGNRKRLAGLPQVPAHFCPPVPHSISPAASRYCASESVMHLHRPNAYAMSHRPQPRTLEECMLDTRNKNGTQKCAYPGSAAFANCSNRSSSFWLTAISRSRRNPTAVSKYPSLRGYALLTCHIDARSETQLSPAHSKALQRQC